MSQAKVEQYKKDKANRKKTMKKEKMHRIAGRISIMNRIAQRRRFTQIQMQLVTM